MDSAQLDQFILNVNDTNRLRDIYGSKLLGELNEKAGQRPAFFVGSLVDLRSTTSRSTLMRSFLPEIREVGRRPSKTTECCFATGDNENKEF